MLRNAYTIARREFSDYFNSPLAYIFITLFLLISGYFFFTQLFLGGEADLRAFFNMAPLIFAIFMPLFTMRLFAEEKQSGTLEMLLSFPITDWEVVLGKFFAALGLLAVTLLLTVPFALYVAAYGPLDKGPAIGGYIGLFLMAGGYLAIGLMASTWTKNQVVAALVGFTLCFGLWIAGKVVQIAPPKIAPLLQAISTDFHFQSIARGVLDTRDLLYYVTIIGVSLVVAQASVESRKWR